jgi:DNA-binding winged helix-turn-helix (wHTH) protein
MMTGERRKHYYAFGPFRLDVWERVLINERGVSVPLTPKAFSILLMLVENSRHVLTKEELMQKIWPDSFVEENNLTQNISRLRRVLSEEGGRGEKFIETIPRRGYRFIADVMESFEEAEIKAASGPEHKTSASGNDAPGREKRKPFLRDVVIIGRAVRFK